MVLLSSNLLARKISLQIVDLMLEDVNKRLAVNGIHLDVTDKVKEKLVNLGYDPKWELVHFVGQSKITSRMLSPTTILNIQAKKSSKLS